MYEKAKEYLSEHGVKPSLQRSAIMDYIMTKSKKQIHPSVNEIYSALSPRIPTLSCKTVYNTVSMLAEKGVILSLDLDGRTHCDGTTTPHAHFVCTRCGTILDIVPDDDFMRVYNTQPPDRMTVTSIQLTYNGLCARCTANNDNNIYDNDN